MKTTRILAATAVAVLASGIAVAASGAAEAATPSCGSNCLDVFSKQFGTFHNPQFVMDVYKQGQNVGQPVILFRQSNADPGEDFTYADQGTVGDFYSVGLMSPQIELHYKNSFAFEVEYAPFGADTGLCVGVAGTAGANEKVTLQPCGVTAATVWVPDTVDACLSNPLYFDELPVINGSDMNFSHPFVLTYPAGSFPTDSPRPQLFVANLTGFSQSGNNIPCTGGSIAGVNSNQDWSAKLGVLF